MNHKEIKEVLQRIYRQADDVTHAVVLQRMTHDLSLHAEARQDNYVTSSMQDIAYILEHIEEPPHTTTQLEYEDIFDSLSHLDAQELNHIIVRAADILRNRIEIAEPPPSPKTCNEAEEEVIRQALYNHRGNKRAAAQELGISERTIHRKAKEYGIDRNS